MVKKNIGGWGRGNTAKMRVIIRANRKNRHWYKFDILEVVNVEHKNNGISEEILLAIMENIYIYEHSPTSGRGRIKWK